MVSRIHFDKTFVINMDKDVQRLEEFDAMMTKCEWEYERFPAVHMKKLTPDQEKLRQEIITPKAGMRPEEVGCALSHISLWRQIVTNNYSRVVIFEDDARTLVEGPSVLDTISSFYNYLHTNSLEEPDVLFLGKCGDACRKLTKVHGNVFNSEHPLCTHAYVVTKRGAERLLAMGPFWKPLDMQINEGFTKGKATVMVYHPSLFFQNVYGNASNLRGFDSALNCMVECNDVPNMTTYVYLGLACGLILCIVLAIFWYFVPMRTYPHNIVG